jgi:branched-chain amino acid transport system permease protein
VVNSATPITNGGMGLTLPVMRLGVNEQAKFFYYSIFLIAVLTVAAAAWVRSHKFGFGLSCIKQNENAARMIGIDTTMFKTLAFALSAVFAGCAGAFNASWVNYIEPGDVFDILLSIKPIVMVLLGGATTLLGPLLGAFIYLILEETVWRNLLNFHSAVLGVFVILIILFRPDGLFTFKWPRILAGRGGDR